LHDLDRNVFTREKTLFLCDVEIERADGARGRGDLAKAQGFATDRGTRSEKCDQRDKDSKAHRLVSGAGKFRPHRIGPIRSGAHRHGEAAGGFVHRLVKHLGVAMQPAHAGTVGRIDLQFDQHPAGAEPVFDGGGKGV
jgi:hypothetical protein